MIYVESIENYKCLGKALKLTTDAFEVVVTIDIGPRIMHFSKPGGLNILEDDAVLGEKLPDGSEWKIYGGHRVWHSPEAFPRSYVSDSEPLQSYKIFDDGILLVQKEEVWTCMQKSIQVKFYDDKVTVTNRIQNKGAWPVDMSVWSLTVGSRKGREVCPVVQRETGLLPNTHYVLWPYSKLNDKRVIWGQKYIVVENNTEDKCAFKFGYPNEYGWIAYFNKNLCFIKKYEHELGANYPDKGCSWETYTSDWGVELESLSPIKRVEPGSFIEHTDEWYLFDDIPMPPIDEVQIETTLKKIANLAKIELPKVSTKGWNPQG